jgi:hypothetical protein
MEAPDRDNAALPAVVAVGIMMLVVVISISGYLLLSGR